MMPMQRTQTPQCLKDNYKKWGREYKQKLNDPNTNNNFSWKQKYQEISDALVAITKNHCSFCDIHPLRASGATIEHFRPKSTFPLISYAWGNLFYCCTNCQKKGNKFPLDFKLLKPDQLSYAFDYYFIYSFSTGIIKAHPARSFEEQKRADNTIDLYGLNKFGRPEARIAERKKFLDTNNPDVESYSFRFILQQ
jgi:uncharacterized protein (TIGR02646 family)